MVCVDSSAIRQPLGPVEGTPSDVASKRLRVLHIQLNLAEN
jgi:hypothetical protein